MTSSKRVEGSIKMAFSFEKKANTPAAAKEQKNIAFLLAKAD
ncbi:hypothetical protein [uncultured Desulfobacter sp.]|nr:hypothetical protein [uncultured Desulfobacter sp.]